MSAFEALHGDFFTLSGRVLEIERTVTTRDLIAHTPEGAVELREYGQNVFKVRKDLERCLSKIHKHHQTFFDQKKHANAEIRKFLDPLIRIVRDIPDKSRPDREALLELIACLTSTSQRHLKQEKLAQILESDLIVDSPGSVMLKAELERLQGGMRLVRIDDEESLDVQFSQLYREYGLLDKRLDRLESIQFSLCQIRKGFKPVSEGALRGAKQYLSEGREWVDEVRAKLESKDLELFARVTRSGARMTHVTFQRASKFRDMLRFISYCRSPKEKYAEIASWLKRYPEIAKRTDGKKGASTTKKLLCEFQMALLKLVDAQRYWFATQHPELSAGPEFERYQADLQEIRDSFETFPSHAAPVGETTPFAAPALSRADSVSSTDVLPCSPREPASSDVTDDSVSLPASPSASTPLRDLSGAGASAPKDMLRITDEVAASTRTSLVGGPP